jgi:hypothetical protein
VLLSACAGGGDDAVLEQCTAGTEEGSTHGIRWSALATYEDGDVILACERLCTESARCLDYAEDGCLAECTGVLEQARQQRCEQSLVSAMECMQRNLCDAGLPTEVTDDDTSGLRHPCALQIAAAACSIVPQTVEPTIFEVFDGSESDGVASIAGLGGTNYTNYCDRSFGSQEYGLSIGCERSDADSPWCCACNADGAPVRAFIASDQACPLGDMDTSLLRRNMAVCGWRY